MAGSRSYIGFGILFLVVSFFLFLDTQPVRAQDPTPTPGGMVPITEQLVPPPLPANPTQADYGSQTYYYVCMVCHGDTGQGLTPDWLEQIGLERNSCWQSKCHASNHPPEGFTLPRTIPGVVGPVLTNRFGSALELYTYIKAAMPWHAPGSLKEEEYWNLTAFLLRLNGLDEGVKKLDARRAARIVWRVPPPQDTSVPSMWIWWVVGGVIFIGLVGIGIFIKYRHRILNE